MARYRYEPSTIEVYDREKQRHQIRPARGYRILDTAFGQIAQCFRDDDAQRIVDALNNAEIVQSIGELQEDGSFKLVAHRLRGGQVVKA